MSNVLRFSTYLVESGEWVIVDRACSDAIAVRCSDRDGAELIAGLMNGDLIALGCATAETAAQCCTAVRGALRVLKPVGWPGVGTEAFAQVRREEERAR